MEKVSYRYLSRLFKNRKPEKNICIILNRLNFQWPLNKKFDAFMPLTLCMKIDHFLYNIKL